VFDIAPGRFIKAKFLPLKQFFVSMRRSYWVCGNLFRNTPTPIIAMGSIVFDEPAAVLQDPNVSGEGRAFA
jgi:hypothetical protein